jgi:hypothetical protein
MSPGKADRLGPVVVGGVGGSGTRVAAQLLREFGFYIGDDLSQALDNRWFGLLLGGRPEWYCTSVAQVPIALRLFEKAMHGHRSFDSTERAILDEAVREWTEKVPNAVEVDGVSAKDWVLARTQSLAVSHGIPADATGWGWKNPNTHIFVEQLAEAFPGMKYVHVIRNGLELVNKTKVKNQVSAWGRLLGFGLPADPAAATPAEALQYWVRANQRMLKLGPELFGDRFLLLGYESVCEDPRSAVAGVAEFLGVSPTPALAERFSTFVSMPPSERDPSLEASQFDAGVLAEVRALNLAT